MSVFDSKQIVKDYIKLRWNEPYVSHALNRKDFGTKPRGIFAGFNIVPVGYRSYKIDGTNPSGFDFQGDPDTYAQGNYSPANGYSIATHSDNFGHETSLVIPPNSVSGTFEFDFIGENNVQKILAIDVEYLISNETTGTVLAIDKSELDANPDYLVVGVINIPSDGVSASLSDIDFLDIDSPRTLPFATPYKYGYMSPAQALTVNNINNEADSLYCSNNDANVWWRIFGVSGVSLGRLDFTGNITYNQPTTEWNLLVATDATTVSGIEDGDIVFFQFPSDGSLTGVDLQIAPNNNLPEAAAGYQTSILGMRCGNDFWFKNGQKWEVGEFKPFGVTSKSPNLTVGETGNPPLSESVSGIFFDNAQVQVLPGGRDVQIYVNVSGSLPNRPLEEEIVATNLLGQTFFTTTEPDLFWINDDKKVDIKVYKNGIKQTQYTTDTSGVYLSDASPIWDWKKAGTRTVEFRRPVTKDGVVTITLEAHRSINALEQTYLVSNTSGQDVFTSLYPFSPDNNFNDITIWRNGVKVQYESLPFNNNVFGATKINDTEIQFYKSGSPFLLPVESVVTIRHEGGAGVFIGTSGGSGGSGDLWSDPVNSNLEPDTDAVYNIGVNKRFRNANFSEDVAMGGDCYIGGKLNVSGGIDPTYIQLTPINPSEVSVPVNSFYVDNTAGNALNFKDNSGINNTIIGGASGISIQEDEIMSNPYPFAIAAPKAVSLSTSGNIFLLTDFMNPVSTDNFFGVLTENVSAFGSGNDLGAVKWRGKVGLAGFSNGPVFVSGLGDIVQNDVPSVSGNAVLKIGIVKNEVLFIRPSDTLYL